LKYTIQTKIQRRTQNASPEAIDRYVEITYRLLRLIDEKPLSYQPLRKYIIDRLDKAGTSVETKRLIGTIDKLDEKISPREAIRLVTASLTNIIYEPGIGRFILRRHNTRDRTREALIDRTPLSIENKDLFARRRNYR